MQKMTIEELYEQHFDRAVRLCYRWLGRDFDGVNDAESVAQEAFIKLFKQGNRLHDWSHVYRACHDASVDALRRRFRTQTAPEEGNHDNTTYLSQATGVDGGLMTFGELLSDDMDVESVVVWKEWVAAVNKLIGELPPKTRNGFLRHVRDGENSGLIGSYTFTSRRMLRERLSGLGL